MPCLWKNTKAAGHAKIGPVYLFKPESKDSSGYIEPSPSFFVKEAARTAEAPPEPPSLAPRPRNGCHGQWKDHNAAPVNTDYPLEATLHLELCLPSFTTTLCTLVRYIYNWLMIQQRRVMLATQTPTTTKGTHALSVPPKTKAMSSLVPLTHLELYNSSHYK